MQQWLPNTGGAWSSRCLRSACFCESEGMSSGTKESGNNGLGKPCENDMGLPMTSSKTSSPAWPTRSCKLSPVTCSGMLNQLSRSNLSSTEHSRLLWLATLNACLCKIDASLGYSQLARSKCLWLSWTLETVSGRSRPLFWGNCRWAR